MTEQKVAPSIKENVLELIRNQDQQGLSEILDEISSKDTIHLISHLNRQSQVDLFTLLSPEVAADVMDEIPDVQAVDIIEDLEVEDAAAIINEMESDEQVDLIKELDDKDAIAILDEMAPDEAESVRRLLTYDDDCAGGMMHTEYFAYKDSQKIWEVIDDLRTNGEKYLAYPIKYLFTIDQNGKLTGVLAMQDLLLANPDTILAEILIEKVIPVNHYEKFHNLVDFFDRHDLFGVPVVDDDRVLVGVLTRRDVLEMETDKIAYEHLETQGIVGGEELRTMPVFLRSKRRLSWLSVNILLNIIAASVIAFHQDTLSSVIALAVFLPIISDMSGCSGNQAVAVSMRELSIGVVTSKEVWRVLWQELSVGIINGLSLGVLIGLAAFFWKGNVYLGLVVGGALALNTILAVCLGGTVPLILKGMKVDPALASGPILTTVTDMFGFFLTLTFASLALMQLSSM